VLVAVRGQLPHLPLVSPTEAATVADDSIRLVANDPGPSGRVASLTALEPGGGTGTLRIGAGGPMMVDFFATWCHACKIDLAAMKAYALKAKAEHLPPLVAVDLRLAEPSTAYVRKFVTASALPFPVGLDSAGKVTDAYGVGVLPTVVLVGDGGKVLWRHTGIVALSTLVQAAKAHSASA
jgi:thiol-disulfide isomerase/thioredoxin